MQCHKQQGGSWVILLPKTKAHHVLLYLLRIWHEVEIDYAPIVQVVGPEEISVLRREEADARVIRSGADHTGINCGSAL